MNNYGTIVKAGWLYRLSDILHIWKKEWAVIYSNGILKFFKNSNVFESEKKIDLIIENKYMLDVEKCSTSPAEKKEINCLIGMKTAEDDYWFTAESEDDAIAWRFAMEQFIGISPPSQGIHPRRPSSTPLNVTGVQHYNQGGYYYYEPPGVSNTSVIHGNDGQYVIPQTIIQHPDGTKTIYVDGGAAPYYCHHGCPAQRCQHCYHCCDGSSAALGFAAGALMFTPFMWGPWFWF